LRHEKLNIFILRVKIMSSVDVIVPCYRYGHFLRQCVESILAQEINVRVLIIDDASPDDTATVACCLADSDARVHFIRHVTNLGHIATYNEGLDWARAEYLLLLSADDYLLPGSLRRSVALLDEHPEVGFVFGEAIIQTEGETLPVREDNLADEGRVLEQILKGAEFIELAGPSNIVHTPTAVVRTELQKRVGGYHPDLPHSGDQEMWLRLAAHASVGFLQVKQAVYRRHSANMSLAYMSTNWLPDLVQRRAALDRFFESCGSILPDAQRLSRRLSWQLACIAVSYASSAFNEGNFESSRAICEFARTIAPKVNWSMPWLKLALKQRIGRRAWLALQKVAHDTR
jgi:glycosyltransferase involved in cell wall biosynthesis